MRRSIALLLAVTGAAVWTVPGTSQIVPQASLGDLAASPLIRLNIAETLRRPPDEASLTVGTEARAPTATAAVAANKVKTERLLAAIRAAGMNERDMQTQGIQLQADYRYDQIQGRGRQTLTGYVASNSILIKTRDIASLTGLLDQLTAAGATTVYGPNFAIADPAPMRREARLRALARGEAEATEYARANGFTRVRLLSVEEGTSFRGTDIVVTGARIMNVGAPPPPPPAPERGGGIIAPGQIDTGVSLGLLYRMER